MGETTEGLHIGAFPAQRQTELGRQSLKALSVVLPFFMGELARLAKADHKRGRQRSRSKPTFLRSASEQRAQSGPHAVAHIEDAYSIRAP